MHVIVHGYHKVLNAARLAVIPFQSYPLPIALNADPFDQV
jgi:hypothetical protein